MYSYLTGQITEINQNEVVLEVNGIGYELLVTNSALSNLSVGQAVKIYTYLAVKEDGVSLYGFLDRQEKQMFLKLISVSGVGAKVAITMLSGLQADRLSNAIVSNDIALLSSIKGIGKKTAERIVLELKDKIVGEITLAPNTAVNSNIQSEAIAALMSLGLKPAEAANAVSKIKDIDRLSVEEIVVKALKER